MGARALITGIAAFSLLSAVGAQADVPTIPKTDPLIGNWCNMIWYKDDVPREIKEKHNIYNRGHCPERAGNLRIMHNGYATDEHIFCEFRRMKLIPKGYEVFSECVTGVEYLWEMATIRFVDKNLYYKDDITDRTDRGKEYCVIVDETPDGYLNLRTGPGPTYETTAKLVKLDELKIDAEFKGWAHVISVDRLDTDKHNTEGWVYRKYTFGCPNNEKEEEKPKATIPGFPPPPQTSSTPGLEPNCYPKWTGLKRC